MSETPSEMTLEDANKFLSERAAEKKSGENTRSTPQSFLDLVDNCLFLCEDSLHDATWDALVIRWAFKLEKTSREDGTLFTRSWENEEIPVFFRRPSRRERVGVSCWSLKT